MRLYIAEKHDMGRKIAAALGGGRELGGSIAGDGWRVSWCQGHLVDLSMPEAYGDSANDLPLLPDEAGGWRWEPSGERGAARQLDTLRGLLADPAYDEVVNCCDPDREGEGVFRRVYRWCGCERPVLRLWAKATTPDAMKKALAALEPDTDYDGLGAAAEARAKADWLYGMNGSRAYRCSVGRVRTPTLAMVVRRDREVDGFEERPFWTVVISCADGLVAEGERLGTRGEAEARARASEGATATVRKAEGRRERRHAPTLPSTTDVQKACSRLLGMKPGDCDRRLESLYMAGLVTYPRTSSQYVTKADLPELGAAVEGALALGALGPLTRACACMEQDISGCADDGRVEGHTALLPTTMLDDAALDGLGPDERGVALVVAACAIMATLPDQVSDVATAEAECNGDAYRARQATVTEPGWTAADAALSEIFGNKAREKRDRNDEKQRENATRVPSGLAAGESTAVAAARTHEGKTAPPRPYTYPTLLDAMKNASRLVEDRDMRKALSGTDVHAAGLGTDATRGTIIDQLEKRGYIEARGKYLRSTELGREIDSKVSDTLRSPLLTASMETSLSAVEHGAMTMGDCVAEASGIARGIVEEAKESGALATARRVGTCPLCGGAVVDRGPRSRSYGCETNRWERTDGKVVLAAGCGLTIPKEVCGHEVTAGELATMLAGGATQPAEMVSRRGKAFRAGMRLEGGRVRLEADAPRAVAVGKCPVCGADVVDRGGASRSYACGTNRWERDGASFRLAEGCGFSIAKSWGGHTITRDEASALLDGRQTAPVRLRSKAGKEYRASLALRDGRVVPVFGDGADRGRRRGAGGRR